MTNLFSVAVPSRHRWECLSGFISSYLDTSKGRQPFLTILHDSPDSYDIPVDVCDRHHGKNIRSLLLPTKSSLTELWNMSVITAPSDWVLICNDDVTFNSGWIEYLNDTIATNKYLMIELFHYGAMCLHKKLILECGWFDEMFPVAGYEDNDAQLRISEAEIKHLIDTSHDFIRKDGDVEIGHYVNHLKYVYKAPGWSGGSNEPWFREKWFTSDGVHFIRRHFEQDWHPKYTMKYSKMYDTPIKFIERAAKSLADRKIVKQ